MTNLGQPQGHFLKQCSFLWCINNMSAFSILKDISNYCSRVTKRFLCSSLQHKGLHVNKRCKDITLYLLNRLNIAPARVLATAHALIYWEKTYILIRPHKTKKVEIIHGANEEYSRWPVQKLTREKERETCPWCVMVSVQGCWNHGSPSIWTGKPARSWILIDCPWAILRACDSPTCPTHTHIIWPDYYSALIQDANSSVFFVYHWNSSENFAFLIELPLRLKYSDLVQDSWRFNISFDSS